MKPGPLDSAIRNSWLTRLADRIILCPSTDRIDPGSLTRQRILAPSGYLESWTCHVPGGESERKVLLIKFPGNAGRAERSTPNPAQYWGNAHTDVWTINPFGYGGSSGTASLQRFPEMVDAVFATLRPQFPDHKIIVYGNSLGSVAALHMAAKHKIDGLYLRNPVPIHQLIAKRLKYALPSLGFSRVIANQIPKTLDAIDNARIVHRPCLFIQSEKDRMIPEDFQSQVINVFAGKKHVFVIRDADHHNPIPESQESEYRMAVTWLLDSIFS